jgi:hypothetical protein
MLENYLNISIVKQNSIIGKHRIIFKQKYLKSPVQNDYQKKLLRLNLNQLTKKLKTSINMQIKKAVNLGNDFKFKT